MTMRSSSHRRRRRRPAVQRQSRASSFSAMGAPGTAGWRNSMAGTAQRELEYRSKPERAPNRAAGGEKKWLAAGDGDARAAAAAKANEVHTCAHGTAGDPKQRRANRWAGPGELFISFVFSRAARCRAEKPGARYAFVAQLEGAVAPGGALYRYMEI